MKLKKLRPLVALAAVTEAVAVGRSGVCALPRLAAGALRAAARVGVPAGVAGRRWWRRRRGAVVFEVGLGAAGGPELTLVRARALQPHTICQKKA